MKKLITIEIDEAIVQNAEAIYETLGMDIEMAITMFLRRTVLEQRFPLGLNTKTLAPAMRVEKLSSGPARQNSHITQSMVEQVWKEFISLEPSKESTKDVAERINSQTGMNSGSAFIYLTILNNLVNAKSNTRTMKFKDLKFYLGSIKKELGETSYKNAIESLKNSVSYWNKPQFGSFSQRIMKYIEEDGS